MRAMSCWAQAIPIGGRPSASVRALQTGATVRWRSGATRATGMSRCAGRRTGARRSGPRRRGVSATRLQRLAPDRQDRVGGQQRIAQGARLLGVGLLGLAARLGVAEVEIAGDAQQLVGADRAARAPRAVGDVGLDRAEIGAPVEDDGQRLAEGEPVHAQGNGDRSVRVDQRPPQELLGAVSTGPCCASIDPSSVRTRGANAGLCGIPMSIGSTVRRALAAAPSRIGRER